MYYFIVNRNSRSGKGKKIWEKIEEELKRSGAAYEAYLTQRPGDAKKFAKELSEGKQKVPGTIVAVGGDGTVNEVLDGLCCERAITFGYIPAGSGNDLARSLKLPQSPQKALQHILSPKGYRLIDYGVVSYGSEEVAHRRFAVSNGMGFDAAVCHEILYSKTKKKLAPYHMGKMVYLAVGLKRLILAKPVTGYLVLDGMRKVEFNHIYFISTHIHPYEGGGFRFAPNADCTDGLLDVSVFNSDSKKKLFAVLVHAYIGNRKRGKGLRSFQCREVRMHVDTPVPVHVDGESCYSQTDLEIRCISKQIRMIV